MILDYALDGATSFGSGGNVAALLLNSGMDPRVLRPYVGDDNRSYIDQLIGNTANGQIEEAAVPVGNATATLRKDDWIAIDEAVLRVSKPRLRLVSDLRGAGLSYNIPNGMAKTVLQFERQTDINAARISMNGLTQGDADTALFDLVNLPLPIIHKDFHIDLRQLSASRSGGSPLDTTNAELAARRVAETAEQLTLGTYGTYSFGGGTIYGYTNFPSRLTQAGANQFAPTNGSWSAAKTVSEVLAMRQASIAAKHFGPWVLYHSLAWDQTMDSDYNLYLGKTLRQRLREIDGIQDVRCVDYLTGANGADTYRLLLVQQSSDVVRMVVGMEIVTLQWETQGGMLLHFKVMCIMVPQLRADILGNTGIVDNTQS